MTVAGLKQKYLFIPSQIRDPYLYHLLLNPPAEIDVALRAQPKKKEMEPQSKKGKKHQHKRRREETPEEEAPLIPSTIIFTQRCATAHLLHLLLNSLEIESVPLHSHLTQPQRLMSLARFRNKEVPVLVTTDVGSRGLDIPEVAMVVNWDCPRRSDDYIHRVGRTARAGKGGVAVTIVTERDVELVQTIEKDIGVELTEMELPEETVLEKMNAVSMARRMATMVRPDPTVLGTSLIVFRRCTILALGSDRPPTKQKLSSGPSEMPPSSSPLKRVGVTASVLVTLPLRRNFSSSNETLCLRQSSRACISLTNGITRGVGHGIP
jgi:ATP-dependent RNA helicase DDX49/DBP8